jgi:hypothetical protein
VLTKAQIRTAVRQQIDDPSAARWTDPNLDILIGMVYEDGWQDILEWAPFYTSQLDTITPLLTPGYIDFAATGGAGQPTKRFFAAQKITRSGREYVYAPSSVLVLEDNALVTPVVGLDGYFTSFGKQLWLFPLELTPEVELRYSYRPGLFSALADGNAVEWPEGHESALVFESAARAMTKGDAESMAQLKQLAVDAWERMRSSLHRVQVVTREPRQLDSPLAWAGR